MKIIKWAGIVFGLIVILSLIIGVALHQSKPSGHSPDQADSLAMEMYRAIGGSDWEHVHYVTWNFMGHHQYTWDKQRNFVSVEWDAIHVLLETTTQTGLVFENGNSVIDMEKKKKYLNKAWQYFCNDSFWLIAPFKIFDPGTSRQLATLKDGKTGLMVTYGQGGITPGDTYIWLLDKNNVPVAWKMWVKVMPIGGLSVTWEGWKTFENGVKMATQHEALVVNLSFSNIEMADNYEDLGWDHDPFGRLIDAL